jgi:tRNA-binding EMAP/Myf-like protein
MGECSNGMTLHRYSMLIDFIVEGFAEGDNISVAILGPGTLGAVRSKPKVDAIKKMKTRGIHQQISIGMILGAEEDGCCEDSLKALNNSPVMATVGSEAEEIEHLKGGLKVDGAAFLLDGESGYPNGDQPILAEGDGRFIMHLPQWRLAILCFFVV